MNAPRHPSSRACGSLRVTVEENPQKSASSLSCHIGRDLVVDYRLLEEFLFQRMGPLAFDFALLTGIIGYVDRIFLRSRQGIWARDLHVQIPVHEPDHWRSRLVSGALTDCLTFLTGDNWSISFVPREAPDPWLQNQQFLPLRAFEPSYVIPFSGGMDSWAVTQLVRSHEPTANLLLVQIKNPSATSILTESQNRTSLQGSIQSICLPFRFRGIRRREHTYRSRSFVYFGAAALAAVVSGCNRVIITENGQGSVGASFLPYAHEWPLRGAHPGFTSRLRRLIRAIFSTDIEFEHRALWSTKGETLNILKRLNTHQSWHKTFSCTRYRPKLPVSNPRIDCGVCGNCLLRRVAIQSAHLWAQSERYIWDDLSATDLNDALVPTAKRPTNPTDISYAIHAVKDMASLGHLASPRATLSYLAVEELADGLNLTIEETNTNLKTLFSQHADEWSSFLGDFPGQSWIKNVAGFWDE